MSPLAKNCGAPKCSVYTRIGGRARKTTSGFALDALKKDPNNPVGRFEFAYILEEEKHWADSLREYQVAKHLAANVKEPMYIDPRGNAYDVDGVREEVDKAIDRVAKLSAQRQK